MGLDVISVKELKLKIGVRIISNLEKNLR